MTHSPDPQQPADDEQPHDEAADSAQATACAACGTPLHEQFYRINQQQDICEQCAQKVEQLQQANRFAIGPWTIGAVAGFVAAVVCGFVWALIARLTDRELGIVAIGVGFVVSWVVIQASRRRGPSIQVLTIIFSVLGILIGKGLIITWAFWDQVRSSPDFPTDVPEWFVRVIYFVIAPVITFSAMDLLWYGLAILQAWTMPKAVPVQMEGPYAMENEQAEGDAARA